MKVANKKQVKQGLGYVTGKYDEQRRLEKRKDYCQSFKRVSK